MLKVVVTENFAASLDAMAQFYEDQRGLFPGAGTRFLGFTEALGEQIVPLLARQPGIGTRLELPLRARPAEQVLLLGLLGPVGGALIVREWFFDQFAVKYAYDARLLILLSAKHHSQHDYR